MLPTLIDLILHGFFSWYLAGEYFWRLPNRQIHIDALHEAQVTDVVFQFSPEQVGLAAAGGRAPTRMDLLGYDGYITIKIWIIW